MILIGQYDSPFVRRVGIALRLYGIAFDHRPWSVFGDAEKLAALNPLVRVPTLVLADGTVLTESHMILDHLDSLVSEERAMFPRHEPLRHRVLRATALATGLADKAVSLFYERRLHDVASPVWEARCRQQIGAVVAVLSAERAAQAGRFWFGDRISHADIALTCAWRFLSEAHPGLVPAATAPALASYAAAFEAEPVFREMAQPFVFPA
ncbi:MAG: glutathione S-transferase family protein [Tabrizicola sp.]|nr:glutathione S-transferase family protein [Tabrizicola sp.]